jgi:hypothetical protein
MATGGQSLGAAIDSDHGRHKASQRLKAFGCVSCHRQAVRSQQVAPWLSIGPLTWRTGGR